MCVIAVADKKRLTLDELQRMWHSNSDGAGVAWLAGGQVHTRKGLMKLKELLAVYKGIPLPHIVHCRTATAGSKSPELTHPFPVNRSARNLLSSSGSETVLFHNGHLADYPELLVSHCVARGIPLPNGEWSDSRAVAWLVAWIGQNALPLMPGKYAALSPKGITTYGAFNIHNGKRFSNYSWCGLAGLTGFSGAAAVGANRTLFESKESDLNPDSPPANSWVGLDEDYVGADPLAQLIAQQERDKP